MAHFHATGLYPQNKRSTGRLKNWGASVDPSGVLTKVCHIQVIKTWKNSFMLQKCFYVSFWRQILHTAVYHSQCLFNDGSILEYWEMTPYVIWFILNTQTRPKTFQTMIVVLKINCHLYQRSERDAHPYWLLCIGFDSRPRVLSGVKLRPPGSMLSNKVRHGGILSPLLFHAMWSGEPSDVMEALSEQWFVLWDNTKMPSKAFDS